MKKLLSIFIILVTVGWSMSFTDCGKLRKMDMFHSTIPTATPLIIQDVWVRGELKQGQGCFFFTLIADDGYKILSHEYRQQIIIATIDPAFAEAFVDEVAHGKETKVNIYGATKKLSDSQTLFIVTAIGVLNTAGKEIFNIAGENIKESWRKHLTVEVKNKKGVLLKTFKRSPIKN